jgi:hypothetical protein
MNRLYCKLRSLGFEVSHNGSRVRNQEKRRTRNGRTSANRLYGSHKSDNHRFPPTTHSKAPFQPCVDTAWMEKVGVTQLQIRTVPEDWTIFDLNISDGDFNEQELKWLREYAADDSEYDGDGESDAED